MLAQIRNNLKTNFNPSYSKKSNRRSQRFNKDDDQPSNDVSHIQQCLRCIVEDCMCLQKNSEIIVFVPIIFRQMEKFKHLPSFGYNDDHRVSFGAKKHHLFNATIDSSPYYDKIISSMPTLDVMFRFKEGNFGSCVHFSINNSKLLTT